jgi:hypothetical protein
MLFYIKINPEHSSAPWVEHKRERERERKRERKERERKRERERERERRTRRKNSVICNVTINDDMITLITPITPITLITDIPFYEHVSDAAKTGRQPDEEAALLFLLTSPSNILDRAAWPGLGLAEPDGASV